MANVSQMDYEAVIKAADGFENASNLLAKVALALEAAMRILQVTAFIGLVGGTAVERYLANIKPKVDALSAKFKEMSGDLREVVRVTREKDQQAAGEFKN